MSLISQFRLVHDCHFCHVTSVCDNHDSKVLENVEIKYQRCPELGELCSFSSNMPSPAPCTYVAAVNCTVSPKQRFVCVHRQGVCPEYKYRCVIDLHWYLIKAIRSLVLSPTPTCPFFLEEEGWLSLVSCLLVHC